jgi:hypothetical protein
VQKSSTVVLGGKEYNVDRAKLKRWLELEGIREQITGATGREDRAGFVAQIYSYLSVALDVEDDFSNLPWYEVSGAYTDLIILNAPSLDFPLLHSAYDGEKVAWDYEGRTWYAWANIFASAFSWKLDYIAELDIDDAIALVQEIRVKDQTRREWEWMLTEVSYDKKGKHKDLPRPHWMRGTIIPENKSVKIKKSMLPVGNVQRWNTDGFDA